MTIDRLAYMLGVDWIECGCFNVFREKMNIHKQNILYTEKVSH